MFLTRQPVQPKTSPECPAHQQIQITHFHATPRKSFRGSSRCDRGITSKGNQRNNRILRNKSLKKFLSFWVIPVPPRVCCDFGMWFFLENGNINRSFDLGPSENHKGVNQLTQQLLVRAVNGEDADPQTVWRRNQYLTSKLLVDKATYTYAYKVLNMITLITWKLYVLKKLQIWVYLCC